MSLFVKMSTKFWAPEPLSPCNSECRKLPMLFFYPYYFPAKQSSKFPSRAKPVEPKVRGRLVGSTPCGPIRLLWQNQKSIKKFSFYFVLRKNRTAPARLCNIFHKTGAGNELVGLLDPPKIHIFGPRDWRDMNSAYGLMRCGCLFMNPIFMSIFMSKPLKDIKSSLPSIWCLLRFHNSGDHHQKGKKWPFIWWVYSQKPVEMIQGRDAHEMQEVVIGKCSWRLDL